MKNKILSIQSKLIYGYVGSNVAELAIQLHGLDVISFPTVLLATHTRHTPIFGRAINKELFDELIEGIKNINVIESTSYITSGYIGSEEILLSSAEFIENIKSEYSFTPYICDPVMGDVGGLYLPEEIANLIMSKLIPQCQILTPNHFEIEYILGGEIKDFDLLINKVKASELLQNKTLIVTSCHLNDTPAGVIETIVINNTICERIHTPKISIDTTGTGDLFTAILASQLTKGKDIVSAVTNASTTISKVLQLMQDSGLVEMNAQCVLQYVNK